MSTKHINANITKEQLEMIGVWKGLLEELFSVKKYKNSELLIIDGLSDKLLNFDEERCRFPK